METDSLSFVYLFLPAASLVFYLTPVRKKTISLLFVSLLFLGLLEPLTALVMLSLAFFDYGCIAALSREKENGQRIQMLMTAFWIKELAVAVWIAVSYQRSQTVPFGVMVVTLSGLGYFLGVRHGELASPVSASDFLCDCFFFGRLKMGPLTQPQSLVSQLRRVKPDLSLIGWGITVFSAGLFKTVVLVKEMSTLIQWCSRILPGGETVLSSWLWALGNALLVYFTLDGYSDMAIGIGSIFSLKLPDNLRYPFQASFLSDFLDRFHMTFLAFIRRYALVPPEKLTWIKRTGSLSVLLECVLLSLWFGPSVNHAAWGLYFGFFILLENVIRKTGIGEKIPALIRNMLVQLFIVSSFCVFSSGSLGECFLRMGRLLGIGTSGLYNDEALYILLSFLIPLAVAYLAMTNVCELLRDYLSKTAPLLGDLLYGAAAMGLFSLSTSYMMENVRWLAR